MPPGLRFGHRRDVGDRIQVELERAIGRNDEDGAAPLEIRDQYAGRLGIVVIAILASRRAANLATIGASAARAMQLVLGTDDVPVSITWSVTGGLTVTRHFDGFWQAAEEEALARIYGGVHYRFDQDAGQHVGRSVAEFVFANRVRPRSGWWFN